MFNDSCTSLLVGKKASLDGSTIVSRNEDGDVAVGPKKMVVIRPEEQPVFYQSASKKFEITLPENPLQYTSTPNADPTHGIWGESGMNEANVAMSATETITTNSRILALDPLVESGLGEEDLLTIILPYIRTAVEGVERLGNLLTEKGTYESNGIAFSDKNEIWWLETLGGHHWAAVRIPDDAYVVAPNRLNIDHFDFTSPNVKYSKDLKGFIDQNHLNPDYEGYNLRHIFGSSTIKDTHYNNPRAWYIQRYFTAQGEENPLSQDLPFIMYPDRKISIEDIKWALSSHYQNTIYDPYNGNHSPEGHRFRPVAINRNNECHVLQLFDSYPEDVSAIHWVAFGPNTFNYLTPFFSHVCTIPDFFSGTTAQFDPLNSYWLNMIAAVLGDHDFSTCSAIFQRYEESAMAQFRKILFYAQQNYLASEKDPFYLEQINQQIADCSQENSIHMLGEMVTSGAKSMNLQYSLKDN